MTRLLRTEVDGVRLTDVEARTADRVSARLGQRDHAPSARQPAAPLATDPEVFAALRANRALVPNAVEESLRLEPPVSVLLRVACEPTEVRGVAIPDGARVAFGIASANRDERCFAEPDRFRLDRRDPKAHLGFGGGPHVCPGSALARLEGRVLLELFVDRVAAIRLPNDFQREKVPVFWAEGPRVLPAELSRA
jgi:cytochrome P450